MKAKLVSIGNSKGIRIPAAILRQCAIDDTVDLQVEKGRIIICPVKGNPRDGWDRAFRAMRERGDDAPLLDEAVDAEVEDWEWK
ncbi:MAG: AbrB/MazE/SpoVT family DNA-binding domain-containing protein [Nitrospirales bacterium]|nr:AbrB/MazE/SpoVT family DNA-binding domain-containing protein [Nitrospirales bacterium]